MNIEEQVKNICPGLEIKLVETEQARADHGEVKQTHDSLHGDSIFWVDGCYNFSAYKDKPVGVLALERYGRRYCIYLMSDPAHNGVEEALLTYVADFAHREDIDAIFLRLPEGSPQCTIIEPTLGKLGFVYKRETIGRSAKALYTLQTKDQLTIMKEAITTLN